MDICPHWHLSLVTDVDTDECALLGNESMCSASRTGDTFFRGGEKEVFEVIRVSILLADK